ncbi:MAG: hypothetical protein A2W25_09540 [candidate division Zixibacteria bacterium RBG_16_53_22]|nr:MAG: hypothetical protein A2W25_09540 [candidate division Zixibacteria bacterium RBG_16_53_22]
MRPFRAISISLVLPMILTSVSIAQFEGAIWDTLTADTLGDGLSIQALSTTPYQLHLTYSKERAGGGREVRYRFFDMLAGWDEDRIVEADIPCVGPVIAAHFADQYDIFVAFESGNDIWGWIAHGPTDWDPVNVTNSPEPEFSPTVALGDSTVHGAWIMQTALGYKIVHFWGYNDSTFADTIMDSNLGDFGSGAAPFIVSVGEAPHLFYRGVNDFGYHIHHAYKEHPDSSGTIEFLNSGNLDDYVASAAVDSAGNIHLAMSGNEGFGMPAHVYYRRRDHQTRQWSPPELVTGGSSATNASIAITAGGTVWIVSCGVSGNFYNGEIYLSNNGSGTFQTTLLASYSSCTQPVIAMINGIYGAVVLDAPIGGDDSRNYEIVYYGPGTTGIGEPYTRSKEISLGDNYPNPFNAKATIVYDISSEAEIAIEFFDIGGKRVDVAAFGIQAAGHYSLTWNARGLPSGVYICRLNAGGRSEARKLLLLK